MARILRFGGGGIKGDVRYQPGRLLPMGWREWTWRDSLADAFEDARHPPDEPHARAVAVVKLLILVAMLAAVVAALVAIGLSAASGYWSANGQ